MNSKKVITVLIAIALEAMFMVYGASHSRDMRNYKERQHYRSKKGRGYETRRSTNAQPDSMTGKRRRRQTSYEEELPSAPTTGDQEQKLVPTKVDDKPTYTAELQQKAEAGDVAAQLDLARCYDSGSGIEKNPVEAHKWFLKAAEQGNGRALNAVGISYENGTGGVEKDAAEAVKWFRKSAELGSGYGLNSLGRCYEYGKGVQKDLTEAVKWYRQSAEQGNSYGQDNLGRCYEYGKGVEKDLTEAAKWYHKSAEQGNASAQGSLGFMYIKGFGVKKDAVEAAKWMRMAAEQGSVTAQYNLGLTYIRGEGVKKDGKEAVKWYQKAAEQGHADAQIELGACYYSGTGVSQDMAEGAKWFRKAADQGNAGGQARLAWFYVRGKGVEKDFKEGVRLARKSAEQGDANGQMVLGVCYFNGWGVKEDIEESFKWLSKAEKQGNKGAKEMLEKPEFSLVRVVRGNADDIEAGEACLQKLKEFKKDGRFSAKAQAPRDNDLLVVKGLYIGMHVEDAVVACGKIAMSSDDYVVVDSRMLKDEKWAQYKALKEKMKGYDGISVLSCKDSKNIQDATRLCVVRLDGDGNISKIFFTREGMDEIFKARNLSTDEFAKALVDNYQQIPSLNKSVKSKRENGADICEYRWTCNARGCNVEVYENTLIVQGREINLREYKSTMANNPNALGVAFGESLFNKYFCIDGNTKKASGAFD